MFQNCARCTLAVLCLIMANDITAHEEVPLDPDDNSAGDVAPLDLDAIKRAYEELGSEIEATATGGRAILAIEDVGVSAKALESDPRVALEDGVRKYLRTNSSLAEFGDALRLVHVGEASRARNDELYVAKVHLRHEGLRITGTSFSCVFAATGEAMGCTGNLQAADLAVEKLPAPRKVEAIDVVKRALSVARLGTDELSIEPKAVDMRGRQTWVGRIDSETFFAERIIDRETLRLQWRIDTSDTTIIYDEETGKLVDRRSRVDDTHDSVALTHASPTATNFAGTGNQTRNTLTERAGFFGPFRINILAYGEDDGWHYAIRRVDDRNSNDVASIVGPGLPGGFTSSTGSALRQQSAYFWTFRARSHFRWVGWNTYEGSSKNDLSVRVDTNNRCTGSACFSTNPRVSFDVGEGAATRPATVLHEYGHYVVWTYGDLNNDCNRGTNESDALDESVAEVFSALVLHRFFNTSGINVRFGGNNNWNPGATAYPRSIVNSTCSMPVWNYGWGFEEAMWEALHGINCQTRGTAGCATLASTNPATPVGDFGWTGRLDANNSLTRALALALSFTGDEPSFTDFRVWMFFSLLIDGRLPQAVALNQVAQFHGF